MTPIEMDHAKGLNGAIAGELRAERGRQRVTFDALASRSGVSKRTLIRVLNGERAINMATLEAICDALNVRPSQIIAEAQAQLDLAANARSAQPCTALSADAYTLAASDHDYDAEIEAMQEEP